jgi:hypothetical protein
VYSVRIRHGEHGVPDILVDPARTNLHPGERPCLKRAHSSSWHVASLENTDDAAAGVCVEIVCGAEASHARSEDKEVGVIIVGRTRWTGDRSEAVGEEWSEWE